MSWLALTVSTQQTSTHLISADALSDVLLELGALSVDINDAHAGTDQELAMFGEPGTNTGSDVWPAAHLTALFSPDADIAAVIQTASDALRMETALVYSLSEIQDQDWVKLTQAQFAPIKISTRLWIVPSWHVSPAHDAINIILDPGLAFGTGSHPTTRLCLKWLDTNLQGKEHLLDYGCGSGILAIAARKLGAASATGIDIDPQAILASRDNAARNHCPTDDVQFYSPADTFFGMGKMTEVDIVMANILANPLKVLAPLLLQALRPGGHLVLSGILNSQADEVINYYRPWINLHIGAEDDGWVLLAGIK
jgi:ribosomal protein L11 methyltransferase